MHSPVLKKIYQEQIVPELKKRNGYANIHQVPRLEKIVLNTGFDAQIEKKAVEEAVNELSSIAGQKAVVTKSTKNISNFKLRLGQNIGAKVTLRGAAMYEFFYRLTSIALPGIRDFRGVNDKLDGNGNYGLGIADTTIFPEVHSDGSKKTLGLDICIVTSAQSDEEGRELLRLLGMPFRKRNQPQAAAKA